MAWLAVSAYCLAVGTSQVVVVSPCSSLAHQHAYPLSELRKPSNTVDIGTSRHTASISSLITVLKVRALSDTKVGFVLSKLSREGGAGNDAGWFASTGITIEPGGEAAAGDIDILIADGYTGTSDVVGKAHVGGVEWA